MENVANYNRVFASRNGCAVGFPGQQKMVADMNQNDKDRLLGFPRNKTNIYVISMDVVRCVSQSVVINGECVVVSDLQRMTLSEQAWAHCSTVVVV